MRAYRVAWLGFCGVVGVAGALVAVTWSLSTVGLLFVLAALTGGMAAMIALTPADNTPFDRDRWPVVATSVVVAGAGAVAFVGLGTLLGGPMAVLVLALAVGGSPYVVRRWIGRLRDHEHLPAPENPGEAESVATAAARVQQLESIDLPAPENPGEAESVATAAARVQQLESIDLPAVEAAELSDDALVLAWRSSFSALQRATSPAESAQIVEARHAYLDELERRNPPGVAAWLASGARAAGNPTRFVTGDGAFSRTTIDWDGLIQGTGK